MLRKIERYARWTAAGFVLLLLCGVLVSHVVMPNLVAYIRARTGAGPTLYLPPGTKLRLGDRFVSVAGRDDCHRNQSWLFGAETGGLVEDRGCIGLGGKTAIVLYRDHGQLTQEILNVVHLQSGVSLQRRDGSPVVAMR